MIAPKRQPENCSQRQNICAATNHSGNLRTQRHPMVSYWLVCSSVLLGIWTGRYSKICTKASQPTLDWMILSRPCHATSCKPVTGAVIVPIFRQCTAKPLPEGTTKTSTERHHYAITFDNMQTGDIQYHTQPYCKQEQHQAVTKHTM